MGGLGGVKSQGKLIYCGGAEAQRKMFVRYNLRTRKNRGNCNPARVAKKRKITPKTELPTECAICLNPISGVANSAVLPCKHKFHASCFTKWVTASRNSQCPVCRSHVCEGIDDGKPCLPMDYKNPYSTGGEETQDLGSALLVNAGEEVEMYMEVHWNACYHDILLGESRDKKHCLALWKQIVYYHRAFVELAYEMPCEIPYSDEEGDIENFLEQFRNIIINAMGILPSPWKIQGSATRADRAFQETETVWLLNILGTSSSSTKGVSLGSRLQMLVQGMACNILSEEHHTSPADLRGQIRARPYSYICSGAANRLHQLGKLHERVV